MRTHKFIEGLILYSLLLIFLFLFAVWSNKTFGYSFVSVITMILIGSYLFARLLSIVLRQKK